MELVIIGLHLGCNARQPTVDKYTWTPRLFFLKIIAFYDSPSHNFCCPYMTTLLSSRATKRVKHNFQPQKFRFSFGSILFLITRTLCVWILGKVGPISPSNMWLFNFRECGTRAKICFHKIKIFSTICGSSLEKINKTMCGKNKDKTFGLCKNMLHHSLESNPSPKIPLKKKKNPFSKKNQFTGIWERRGKTH